MYNVVVAQLHQRGYLASQGFLIGLPRQADERDHFDGVLDVLVAVRSLVRLHHEHCAEAATPKFASCRYVVVVA
jgi:hypothetical protein